jgi:hypothetical protein
MSAYQAWLDAQIEPQLTEGLARSGPRFFRRPVNRRQWEREQDAAYEAWWATLTPERQAELLEDEKKFKHEQKFRDI